MMDRTEVTLRTGTEEMHPREIVALLHNTKELSRVCINGERVGTTGFPELVKLPSISYPFPDTSTVKESAAIFLQSFCFPSKFLFYPYR